MTLPQKVYSIEQIRELDRRAIEDHHIPGLELMSRAATATFSAIKKQYSHAKTMAVICGVGNNAGDGYLLAKKASGYGWIVSVYQVDDKEPTGDALSAKQEWLNTGSEIQVLGDRIPQVDIVVDAVFGTGLTRVPEHHWEKAIDAINTSLGRIVSIDIPSGLDGDTGVAPGAVVKADMTITFIGMKKGLLTGKARDYTGILMTDNLDIPDEIYVHVESNIRIIPEDILKNLLTPRAKTSHKGDHGRVLIVGGNEGMPGAVLMSAQAAARTGAGLINVATHSSHSPYINLSHPEIISNKADDLGSVRELLEQPDAIAMGPGLGTDAWAARLLPVCLYTGQPKVLDADALSLMAMTPSRRNDWILTPHPGEAARLLSIPVEEVEKDRYAAVAKMQEMYGGICVLKGAGTLVASEQGIAVCTDGNAGMATAGSGDVLTGVIVSLLAQGFSTAQAAIIGVHLHARAGDLAAQQGQRGMMATDIIESLRGLVNQ